MQSQVHNIEVDLRDVLQLQNEDCVRPIASYYRILNYAESTCKVHGQELPVLIRFCNCVDALAPLSESVHSF